MRVNLIIVILSAMIVTSCSPKIAPNVKIFESNALGGPCEPSISINPSNTDNIVAGSILKNVHISMDGGKTWETVPINSTHGVYGDPCLITDSKGRSYYFHLGDPNNKGRSHERWLESIVVQRSDDLGKTWNNGSAIGANGSKDQDKEWAVTHPLTDEIYVTWTEFDKYGDTSPECASRILFSKSNDLGETWTKPLSINQFNGNCIDDDQTVEGAVPAVDKEGNVFVAWAYDEKIYFDRSIDGGETWLEEDVLVAEHPGGWSYDIDGVYRCNGMPVTVVDNSDSDYKNRLYVCWGAKPDDGKPSNIWLAYSDNQGDTWSEPVNVHGSKSDKDQFFPWMAVDPITGYIYVVYYDRTETTDWNTSVTLSISKDGGSTFRQKQIAQETFQTPGKLIFFGDYNNISAYNGMVRPIWTQYSDGRLSVWTALLQNP